MSPNFKIEKHILKLSMLWYGVYYIILNLLLLLTTFFISRLYSFSSTTLLRINTYVTKVFMSFVLFFYLVAMLSLHDLLDKYSEILTLSSAAEDYLNCFTFDRFSFAESAGSNLIQVYYFPFLYVFLFVTVLSVVYCLSYNSDELHSFMLYVLVILSSGYLLFFTDSLILFFLAYEMLLIPSFFILYKFAKTRRCVEAAYLMFFWTQFGALFLIFAIVYVLLIANTSQFSTLSLYYFSDFEVNFLFICLIIGFGVKLPI